jgi:hypothetical protein
MVFKAGDVEASDNEEPAPASRRKSEGFCAFFAKLRSWSGFRVAAFEVPIKS